MEPISQNSTPKKPNIWLITSVILAIALAASLFTIFSGSQKNQLTAISADEAGNKLIDFINKIYGAQIGSATLKSVSEKNGLYQATIGLVGNGQPVEENVFITQDGLLFIPQTINIDETLSQFQALDQQPQPESQNLAPVNGSDQTPQE